MNTEKYHFPTAAIAAALNYAGLDNEQVQCAFICREDELFEIAFRTDWLKYDCYVDADTLDVLGFNTEPVPDDLPAGLRADGVLRKLYSDTASAGK